MINNRWGRRNYVRALSSDLDPGGGVSRNEDDVERGRANLAAQARLQGVELQKEAAKKKLYFQQKMVIEGNRKGLGKGNILVFTIGDPKQGIEYNDVNKVLRIGGFNPDQVKAIKLSDFRVNQVEVLFRSDVEIDTLKIEEKLRTGEMYVQVSRFDHAEEYVMLYGLPPTSNIEKLKELIIESTAPFVRKILEVTPCIHRGVVEDDFFSGKFDGNWRMKVIPRNDTYIPNFAVVGRDVMAKVVYTKRVSEKDEMCTDCYRIGHFRKECPGGRKWSDYCKEFRDKWSYFVSQVEEDESEEMVEDDNGYTSKLRKVEAEKEELLKKSEKEGKEFRDKVSKQQEEIERLKRSKDVAEKEIESVTKSKNEVELRVNRLQEDLYRLGCDSSASKVIQEKERMIEILEEENYANKEEIIGLKKTVDAVETTMKENDQLKKKMEMVERENLDLRKNIRDTEAQFKSTTRRISRSFDTETVDLNDTVSTEMFREVSMEPENAPPFHGFTDFSPPVGNDVIVGNKKDKAVTQNSAAKKSDDNSERPSVVKLKRNNSSPGTEYSKRRVRHPKIGSYIVLDTIDAKGVHLVKSKVNNEENDFLYNLGKEDKVVTLNLKRVNWQLYDRGEKIALKPTV